MTDVSQITAASAALTDALVRINGQMDSFDAEIAERQAVIDAQAAQIGDLQGQFDTWAAGATASVEAKVPLGPNLISNGMMDEVDSSGAAPVPVGFFTGGLELEAVHPYTQGFEGTYTAEAPANAVSDPNLATEAAPMWYGVYNIGPQQDRGGMRSGWAGAGRGHILKITGSAANPSNHRYVGFPLDRTARVAGFGFRCWVKLVSGSRIGFGNSGFNGGGAKGHIVTAADCAAAPAGWVFVDIQAGGAPATMNFMWQKLFAGFDLGEDIEAYLAMPYVWVPATQNNWFME